MKLPFGCTVFGSGLSLINTPLWLEEWINDFKNFEALLVIAGSRTAEVKGISSAGSTSVSRRYTALADAQFLLNGPLGPQFPPLPPLPAGVSPALISHVASKIIGIKPLVLAVGLHKMPEFPHLQIELPSLGPAQCLSTGRAMKYERVQSLWDKGFSIGSKLRKPLLIAECVPGGTTTAQAVLTGLGLQVGDLISGSVINPPISLKKKIVDAGLRAANLGIQPSPKRLVAAVGDPFQSVAAGLVLGAREAGQRVLLGGGSQMVAVLALALSEVKVCLRADFVKGIALGTTAWLVEENLEIHKKQSSLVSLLDLVGNHFDVGLLGMSSGLRFHSSRHQALKDYERGFIKEGVGAGAFALIAQFHGTTCQNLVEACEESLDELKRRSST